MAVKSRSNILKVVLVAGFVIVLALYFSIYESLPNLLSGVNRNPVWAHKNEAASDARPGGHDDNSGKKPPTMGGGEDHGDDHAISRLIEDASASFAQTITKRSWSLAHAAARYRERRGRHPPPGFDVWFEAAQSHGAVVMRRKARAMPDIIRVRDGKIRSDRLDIWRKLVEKMLPHLPDLDMPVNLIDEPRMLVPWDDVSKYVTKEQSSRQIPPLSEVTPERTSFEDVDADQQPFDPGWIDDKARYWDYVSRACPPDSPGRKAEALEKTMEGSIDAVFPTSPTLPYMEDGFVRNFTAAKDPCLQPHLRGMHGTFVEPLSMLTTTKLFPLFSGSKLPTNNELLIPAAMYFSGQGRYSGGSTRGGGWEGKKDALVWRGTASGGRNKESNWWRFQRHRFVQMLNGTAVALVEKGEASAAPTFNLVAVSKYNLSIAQQPPEEGRGRLGEWVKGWSDVGFNRLECFPGRRDWLFRLRRDCPYTDAFYALADTKPMRDQYDYKFLPDVDGNSYSARWRPFLQSTSCPLKATAYAEWHDDRLVPWLHFVPLDNSFVDVYAVMDYLLSRDDQARRIAHEGREWAAKAMRDEDMMLYTWRLLLEYARVLDPKREQLGYVGDLV
ncbi:lipopolysaccharide-modifying protein [Xylariaceae sp. FL0594]|nr:lipopolysaccharide-modifying protein [Xylariaceae sp. FL0594]